MGEIEGIIIPGYGVIGGGTAGGAGGKMSATGAIAGGKLFDKSGSGKLGVWLGIGAVEPMADAVGGTCKSRLIGLALRDVSGAA